VIPTFLAGVGLRSSRPERELAVDQSWQEHGLELQPLRAMVGEEVHATAAVLGGEAVGEFGEERGVIRPRVRALELRCQGTHPREVRLAGDLFGGVGRSAGVVAELVGDDGDDLGDGALRSRPFQPLQDPARPRPPQERSVTHLIRDPGGGEGLLERLGPRVDPVEHRDLLEWDGLLLPETTHRLDDRSDLGVLVRLGTRDRRRSGGPVRSKRLPHPSEARRESVRELENLRCGAIVLLEPDDGRVREPPREAQ
jgi:hypothetical protein